QPPLTRTPQAAHYRVVELSKGVRAGARGRTVFLPEEQRAREAIAAVYARRSGVGAEARHRSERSLARWILIACAVEAVAGWPHARIRYRGRRRGLADHPCSRYRQRADASR